MDALPWLRAYDPGIPPTLRPYPDKTLVDCLAEAARARPHAAALYFKGATVSYRQLHQQSNALAAAFSGLGVRRGSRVALLLPNCPQAVLAQVAAWKVGALVAPLNPLYTPAEIEHALALTGAETVVALTLFYDKVKAVQPHTVVRHVLATSIGEYLPLGLRLAFHLFRERRDGHRIRLRPGDLWLADCLWQQAQAEHPAAAPAPEDPALLIFTGGTTGAPKAAVATHGGLLMAGMQMQAWSNGLFKEWHDSVVLALPLFHAAGNVGALTFGLLGHYPLVLIPNPRDLDDLLAAIRRTRPALLPGVPTLFHALLEHPAVRAHPADLHCLKLSFAGAAPLLAETRRRWETLTGGRIVEAYALTESVMAAVMGPVRGRDRPGAVGLPLPDVEVRAVALDDPINHGPMDDAAFDETPAALPPGVVGELIIRAPQLMAGYWQDPKETYCALRYGWLYTGDLGYLDADGYVYVVDRKKDLIKPSGFQVWPREVEEVLARHPAVAEVGVAGVPDAHQGEAVAAWVVLRPGVAPPTVEALRGFCRERLAAYKVPRRFEFCSDLPKSAIGKVLRRELTGAAEINARLTHLAD
ncbi:MAG: AMP-binding protein [Anaerolineales bacterium]|nr:AMP-binding protein [Anaerolineales bacterium]